MVGSKLIIFHADPTTCTGNGIYSSFRQRNFWLEYSTPPTTRYPEYEDYFFQSSPGQASTPVPGPHFLTANHSRIHSPVGSTTFLHCQVDELRDLQVTCFSANMATLDKLRRKKEMLETGLKMFFSS